VSLDAVAFSKQRVEAWNAHDVEAVLGHFHDDVLFTSPVAATVLPETAGVVRGKPALRRYWTQALQRIANLRFVVEAVYQGVDTVVIVYRNQDGGLVSEVLRFSGDVVVEGHGTYIVAE
jgi:ketosteroid isomerase-like protein